MEASSGGWLDCYASVEEKMKARRLKKGIAIAGLCSLAGVVQAASFCSGSVTHPDGLKVSDMTFGVSGTTAQSADDCYGVVIDNDPGGTTSVVFPDGGNPFTFLAKDDTPGGTGSGTGTIGGGINFTLTAGKGKTGTWSLTWEDVSGAPDLPITLDLLGVLKASDRYASYLFEAEQLTSTNSPGSGDFTISFKNNGQQNPDLSHLSLYYRNVVYGSTGGGGGSTSNGGVPEPGTVALLAVALLGLGVARRRFS